MWCGGNAVLYDCECTMKGSFLSFKLNELKTDQIYYAHEESLIGIFALFLENEY